VDEEGVELAAGTVAVEEVGSDMLMESGVSLDFRSGSIRVSSDPFFDDSVHLTMACKRNSTVGVWMGSDAWYNGGHCDLTTVQEESKPARNEKRAELGSFYEANSEIALNAKPDGVLRGFTLIRRVVVRLGWMKRDSLER
jgi:hypothetical protein